MKKALVSLALVLGLTCPSCLGPDHLYNSIKNWNAELSEQDWVNELVFLGREIGEQRNYSDEVAKQIDEEVRAIIDHAYERAMEVLVKHRDKLTALAEKLVAEETVDAEEFEKLFSDLPPKENVHGARPAVVGPGQPTPAPAPNPQPA